jgi:hypothetical protein
MINAIIGQVIEASRLRALERNRKSWFGSESESNDPRMYRVRPFGAFRIRSDTLPPEYLHEISGPVAKVHEESCIVRRDCRLVDETE